MRLHRQIAEALEARVATYAPERQAAHAGELAYQYHRSAAIPGAERGVDFALQAADVAEASSAWEEQVGFLTMALDLLPDDDPRRGRIQGRLAVAQGWALAQDEAERNAVEAVRIIAAHEGGDAAADYLAEAQFALAGSGRAELAWRLARLGLQYISPERRDLTWARLTVTDLHREDAEDPDNPGIPLPSALNDLVWDTLTSSDDPRAHTTLHGNALLPKYTNRQEALAYVASEREWALAHPFGEPSADPRNSSEFIVGDALTGGFILGDLRAGLAAWQALADFDTRRGAVAIAIGGRAQVARLHYALGEIAAGDAALELTREQATRFDVPGQFTLQLVAAEDELRATTGDWTGAEDIVARLSGQQVIENRWAAAAIFAGLSRALAMIGQSDSAIALVAQTLMPLERAPGTSVNYPRIACNDAETMWITERADHIEPVERALRDKVVGPDFRYPNVDGRLELARLCALTGRFDEASEWFAKARAVLEEQGARPLRAICDYDEALMYIRRNADGDRERAGPLLDAALTQFREIGMTGWVTRGEELRSKIAAP